MGFAISFAVLQIAYRRTKKKTMNLNQEVEIDEKKAISYL